MCDKVTVSLFLFTLNAAEFYIYCVRISRFKAWPISAPAYFSPCGNFTIKVVPAMFIIRCWFQNIFSRFFLQQFLNLGRMGGTADHPAASCHDGICLSVSPSVGVSAWRHILVHTVTQEQTVIETLYCHMLWQDCQIVQWSLIFCLQGANTVSCIFCFRLIL